MVKMDANSVLSSAAIVVAIIVWVGGDGGSVAVVGGGSFNERVEVSPGLFCVSLEENMVGLMEMEQQFWKDIMRRKS